MIEHSRGGVVLLCGEVESPEKHGEDTVVLSVPFPAPPALMVVVFYVTAVHIKFEDQLCKNYIYHIRCGHVRYVLIKVRSKV